MIKKELSEFLEVKMYSKDSIYLERTMINGDIWYIQLSREQAATLVRIITEEMNVCPHCFEIITGNRCYCVADD